jgi:hypothetical protein
MLLDGDTLQRELLEARVQLRIAELRVIAAKQFARRTAAGCLPTPAPAPSRRPQPRRDALPLRRLGGGGLLT